MPLGAIAFTLADKLKVGLQQLMAGSRNFRVSTISRSDLMALTPEAAQVSASLHHGRLQRRSREHHHLLIRVHRTGQTRTPRCGEPC